MPKPSTGCSLCRQRHVKCDETKPDCNRCLRLGRACPGYRDTCGIIIQDVTARVNAKYQRHKSIGRPQTRLSEMLRTIPDDRLAASVAFLFAEYVQTSSLLKRPYFEYLPQLYNASESTSALALTVTFTAALAARLYFGDHIGGVALAERGSKALRAMQAAVINPKESARDETLLAVLCLDFAEHLASRSDAAAASRAHIKGALLLVQHRPPQSFANPVSASLITGTSSIVLLSALWSNGEMRTQDALAILPDVDVRQQGPYAELHQLLSRELDSDMDWWLQSLPPEWQTLLIQPTSPSSVVAKNTTTNASTLEMTFILAQWHCTKLLALRLLYAAVISQRPHFPGQDLICEDVLSRVQSVTNNLCNLVSLIANTAPPNGTRGHRMERGLSGIVPAKSGEASDWKGGAMDAKHCCLNILRWVLSILVDEKESVPGFGADRRAVDYFTEAMRAVQKAFTV
ncbi:hypothetical protein PRZ48_014833 [Zasmidium cellare]|uniref:Zn(2)-C6 fungal-type domain-containing protein n=1 Tax=Zasmidium cellare TaxID=395010 RepID=A0ABR0DXH8_ZASCE|nr:hypothetical protein PRZ48_014833 [Zasmidium cellare]